jgi:competence protein ComEA
MEGIRERLAGLERRQLVGLLGIGAIVIAVAVVWFVRSMPSAVTISADRGPTGPAGPAAIVPAAAPSPTSQPMSIVVDVAGRVRHPGVYTFQQGDRVIDAIRRAGGALRGSDLTGLNLAALLTDAEQIVVGRAGGPGSTSGTSVGSGGTASGGSTPGKVDLNTATLDQLEALPGIGPVLAQRILDYRQQHGPFHAVQDLLNVSGIGDAHLADLEPLVTVS